MLVIRSSSFRVMMCQHFATLRFRLRNRKPSLC